MTSVHGMPFRTTACPAPWPPDAIITPVLMFLKMFHFCKNRNFDILCVQTFCRGFTDLFVIKLSTCKGFVCLVAFL